MQRCRSPVLRHCTALLPPTRKLVPLPSSFSSPPLLLLLPSSRLQSSTAPSKLRRLEGAELQAALKEVGHWQKVGGKEAVHRSFAFDDFNAAFAFMTRSALLAEKMGHHPAWFNVYNRVDVELETHDVQGLSHNDFVMARAMDEYAKAVGGR